MRWIRVAICALVVLEGVIEAQQPGASLGEIARQERARKKAAANKTLTNEDLEGRRSSSQGETLFGSPVKDEAAALAVFAGLSPVERRAALNVVVTAALGRVCKKASGTFVPAHQIWKEGCRDKNGRLLVERDPGGTPEKEPPWEYYDFQFSPTNADAEAIPRKPGVGGFLCTEKGIFYNPKGPASDRDRQIDLRSIVALEPEIVWLLFAASSGPGEIEAIEQPVSEKTGKKK